MRDVAERAGVSTTTVSHVINETRFVEEKTKQRVLQAIAELGYRPSAIARSLTTNRTQTVGVIVSDSSNYFFAEVLRGIEDVLRPEDYALLVCNTAEILERESHYLDLLLRQQVDGIIAAATSQRWDVLTEFEMQHTPIVFVDRAFEGLAGPFVGVDNRRGAYLGTTHLIECGHRRIGILAGFQRLSTMRERLAGFKHALGEHGIPLQEEWIVESPLGVEAGQRAMRSLLALPEHPTAVFLNNNLLSLGALLAMVELGVDCPEGMSVVGFDDHPWAAVSDPPLTVVRQPTERIGQTAAEILLGLLKGEQTDETNVWLECELVERQSCCPPSA
jgi:DNA-binding LacI/PurR family transcriptional regulator